MVPAPGRLSTTTCWLQLSASLAAMARAITSVKPPAAKPTRKRSGRFGYCCASWACVAPEIHAMPATALKQTARKMTVGMAFSLSLRRDRVSGIISAGHEDKRNPRACAIRFTRFRVGLNATRNFNSTAVLRSRVLTIPNVITVTRLVLVPVMGYFLAAGTYGVALIV